MGKFFVNVFQDLTILISLLLDLQVGASILRLGRHLETRLRMAFLSKLPYIPDNYFQSRVVSDMVMRGHNIYKLRQLP